MDAIPTVPTRSRAGFSLLEVLCAMTVLLAGTLAFSRTLIALVAVGRAAHERTSALEAAQRVLEQLSDEQELPLVLCRYDAEPANDPDGPATAPGASFDVAGLSSLADDLDGHVGEVVLPLAEGKLFEDVVLGELGLPRDLDADGRIDARDHRADCRVLPVLVRVRWRGRTGPTSVQLETVLCAR
jgi:prepilin-type N-terminal cleavage/methylation domain-containing protein